MFPKGFAASLESIFILFSLNILCKYKKEIDKSVDAYVLQKYLMSSE